MIDKLNTENKTLKITIKNNNGTEFSYYMHYDEWVAEQEFMKKKERELGDWWINNYPIIRTDMVKLDGKSMKMIAESLLQTKKK